MIPPAETGKLNCIEDAPRASFDENRILAVVSTFLSVPVND